MKYISFIFFAAFMAWTWNVIHSEASVSFETHSSIQEKLATLIQNTIKAKKPDATDIVVEKVWTEYISQRKLKAYFVYSFKAPSAEGGAINTQISGEGLLEKEESSTNSDLNEERWHLSKVKTSNDAISFTEGTLVTAGESDNTAEGENPEKQSEKAPSEEKPSAPNQESH